LIIFEKWLFGFDALSIILGKQLIFMVLGQAVLNRLGWALDLELLQELLHLLLLQLRDQEAR